MIFLRASSPRRMLSPMLWLLLVVVVVGCCCCWLVGWFVAVVGWLLLMVSWLLQSNGKISFDLRANIRVSFQTSFTGKDDMCK